MTEKGYLSFRQDVKDFRDKFVAHREINRRLRFPDIDIARDMCLELRNIFRDLYNSASSRA